MVDTGRAEISVMKAAALTSKDATSRARVTSIDMRTQGEVDTMQRMIAQKGGKDALHDRLGRSEAEAKETPSFFSPHGVETMIEFGAGAAKIVNGKAELPPIAPGARPTYTEQQRIMFEAAKSKITDTSCVLAYLEVNSDSAPGLKFDQLYRPGGALKDNPELKGAHNFAELKQRAVKILAQDEDVKRIFRELPGDNTPAGILARETFVANTILQDPRLRTIMSHRMNEIRKAAEALEPPQKAEEIEGKKAEKSQLNTDLKAQTQKLNELFKRAGFDYPELAPAEIEKIVKDSSSKEGIEMTVKYILANKTCGIPDEAAFNRVLKASDLRRRIDETVLKYSDEKPIMNVDSNKALLLTFGATSPRGLPKAELEALIVEYNSTLANSTERDWLEQYRHGVQAMFDEKSTIFPQGASKDLDGVYNIKSNIDKLDKEIQTAERVPARSIRKRIREELDLSVKLDRVLGDSVAQLLEEKIDQWEPVEQQRADEAKQKEIEAQLKIVDDHLKNNWSREDTHFGHVRRRPLRNNIQRDMRYLITDGEDGVKRMIARDLGLRMNLDRLTPNEREMVDKVYVERGQAYRDKLMMSHIKARKWYDRGGPFGLAFGRLGLSDQEWALMEENFGAVITENFDKVCESNTRLAELRKSGAIPDNFKVKWWWALLATLGLVSGPVVAVGAGATVFGGIGAGLTGAAIETASLTGAGLAGYKAIKPEVREAA